MADYNTSKSNLLEDSELCLRFHREALAAAYSLKSKYFSVFEFMTAEDVVMECWDKILRQNISFNESKGCQFSTFVRMMVKNRCIDMSRRIRKHEGVLSLDEEFMGVNGETFPLVEFVSDKSGEFEGLQGLLSILDTCYEDFSGVDLKHLISMKLWGFKDREIADALGIRPSEVKKILDGLYDSIRNRGHEQKTLADILYGDEDELDRQKDRLAYRLAMVKDDRSGMKLLDVVKMVIEGSTYSQIGNKYHVSAADVRNFLDKYHEVVI